MKRFINPNSGFTLLEILVVVGLLVIILGLVFGPLVKSFDFTRRAEVMVRTQDNARLAIDKITQDLSNAMYVYDNTRVPILFRVRNEAGNDASLQVYYAKIDMVLPRMQAYCSNPNHNSGQPRNFPRGDEASPRCPHCSALLELRPMQPLAPDTMVVRYFIGLRDPTKPYRNGYTFRYPMTEDDNMYVLYRAEFSPGDDANGNNRLFPTGNDPVSNLNMPDFFYQSGNNSFGEPYTEAWRKIARPMVTVHNTDLINLTFNPDGSPIVMPTVRFMPTPVYNDPMVATVEAKDDPEHGDTPPTVYKATYGNWVLPYEVTLYRKLPQPPGGIALYKAKADPTGSFMGIFGPNGALVFNIAQYEATKYQSPYGVGVITPQRPEVAFTVDPAMGTVNFAFPAAHGQFTNPVNGAVSKVARTDDINAEYQASFTDPTKDRCRQLLINLPTDAVSGTLLNSRVVAGSERVIAPNAAPGEAYGRPLLYSRTPFYLSEPGLNQYKVDLEYPWKVGGNLVPGVAAIQFHSDQTAGQTTGVPLPPCNPRNTNNVFVFYQVQNNQKDDSLRANYITKSLITITLGVKAYDPASGKPQALELTNKVRIRNVAK